PREQVGEPGAKPLVHVGQLGGQIAKETATHAVTFVQRVPDAPEEAPDLIQSRALRIFEARLDPARDEQLDDAIEDRVAEVFLASEVVIEIALSYSAGAQHVIERRVLIPLEVDQ